MTNKVLQTLFVYGSLKRGFYNNCVLKDSNFVKEDTITAPFTMISFGSFPALVQDNYGSWRSIKGEIFELTDKDIIKAVESLEGFPSFYKRKSIVTNSGVLCDVYVLNENSNYTSEDIVDSGEWTE